ncbi:MAG: tetratricopeptide repeat protein [Saprospiraceae bacterium]
MARRKKNKQEEDILVDIVDVRDNFQGFYEKNQKVIWGVLGGLVLLVGGYFIYTQLYLEPRQKEAMTQMYQAQKQFEQDSFAKALTNPGALYPGFLDIQDQYGGTKAANLASYYAGVSYLNLGKFDAAVDYLKSYKASNPEMTIMKNGALGDAYSELQDFGQAMSSYQKAANSNNDFLTPYYLKKVGMLHERNGNTAEASKVYNKIKADFPQSNEARDIDKFLARVTG